jgi:hypothetical protein
VLIATAWVTWCRSRGQTTPGQRWATTIVPLATAWALVKPLKRQLPVFPYAYGGKYGDRHTSSTDRCATGALAGAVIALTLTGEGRPWERLTK